MKIIKEKIVNHFIEEHKRLLGGASLSPENIHPGDIVTVGDISLKPSTSEEHSLDFSAHFQAGRMSVFYFGTITDNWNIINEAVAGRRADGTLPD